MKNRSSVKVAAIIHWLANNPYVEGAAFFALLAVMAGLMWFALS